MIAIVSVVTTLVGTLFVGCDDDTSGTGQSSYGKELAKKYCQSCHLLPEPSLLNKERWQNMVLPVMGLYLGTTPHDGIQTTEVEQKLFPANPLLSGEEWQQLVDYYISEAPEALPGGKPRDAIDRNLPFDVLLAGDSSLYNTTAITSYVKIDTSVMPHRIIVSNSTDKKLLFINQVLKVQNILDTEGPVVDLLFKDKEMFTCVIGKDVTANDFNNGFISRIKVGSGVVQKEATLFDSLARPVQVQHADLDKDGNVDFLISEFGNLIGSLSWMKNDGHGRYTKTPLSTLPGALRSVIDDVNKDGLPDIWVQFSQGEEGLFLFMNQGSGTFLNRAVIRFPPSYGSSSFEIVDYNQDGFSDIVYTCGDNGDYSRILKPYHGVYIFLNDGKNNFEEKFFYPINGCYKALSRDFDGDGDLDIAAISYFPAAATPWESFVYLENRNHFQYKAHTLPLGIPFQKGVTMDAADFNGDGSIDLVLGNGYYTSKAHGDKEPLFILLKNKTKPLNSNLK